MISTAGIGSSEFLLALREDRVRPYKDAQSGDARGIVVDATQSSGWRLSVLRGATIHNSVGRLDIRIPGEITREKVATLQAADAIYLEEIRRAGLYDQIWQAFAVLLPVKTVGVMGDARTYEDVCALRAVTSTDGMTADFFEFPWEVLGRCATRIINEVRGVNRVVYDVTSKPPGTIEWE